MTYSPRPGARLGDVQKHMIRSLKDHNGCWYSGCGWYYDTHGQTIKILDSLERRGLVERAAGNPKMYTLVIGWETRAHELGYRP